MKPSIFAPISRMHKAIALCIVCMMFLSVASCEKAINGTEPDEPDVPEKECIEIPSVDTPTVLSLSGTGCRWKSTMNEVWGDWAGWGYLRIIRSNAELNKFLDCTGDYQICIDFSANTLLLVNATLPTRHLHEFNFFPNGSGGYVLHLVVPRPIHGGLFGIIHAILIPLIPIDVNVDLNIEIIELWTL